MKDEILKEVHKYDNKNLLKKYRLDLRDLTYLLILGKFLNYNDFIFSLQKEYEKYYNNIEIRKTASSNHDTNNKIEINLKNLGLITKEGNHVGLTPLGEKVLNEINININGNNVKKFELFIEENALISFILSVIGIILATISLLK